MSVIIIIVTSATDELSFPFSALLMGPLQADLTLDQYNGSGPVISVQLETFQARPPGGQYQGPPRVFPVSSVIFSGLMCVLVS